VEPNPQVFIYLTHRVRYCRAKSVKVRQTKSELGAVATSPRLNLRRVGYKPKQSFPLLDRLAGRYRSPVLILRSSVEGFQRHLHLRSTGDGRRAAWHTTFLNVRQACYYWRLSLVNATRSLPLPVLNYSTHRNRGRGS